MSGKDGVVLQAALDKIISLTVQRDALYEALKSCIEALTEIDNNTSWSETEPAWWLTMMEVQRKARAALALVEGKEGEK